MGYDINPPPQMLKEHRRKDDRKVERAGGMEDRLLGETVLWRGLGCSTRARRSCGYFSRPKIKLSKNLNMKWEGTYKPRPCPTEMLLGEGKSPSGGGLRVANGR